MPRSSNILTKESRCIRERVIRESSATTTVSPGRRNSSNLKPAPQNDIRHLPALLKAARTIHGRIDFNGLQVSIETGRSRSRTWTNLDDGSIIEQS